MTDDLPENKHGQRVGKRPLKNKIDFSDFGRKLTRYIRENRCNAQFVANNIGTVSGLLPFDRTYEVEALAKGKASKNDRIAEEVAKYCRFDISYVQGTEQTCPAKKSDRREL